MENLEVFDCANTFIASYFTDDRGCAHCCREHTLIYLHSGELEITDSNRKTILHSGDCAFMRRDNNLWLQKRVKDGTPYHSIVLKFNRELLHDFYRTLNRKDLPTEAIRNKRSLYVMPPHRADIKTLFASILPCFETGFHPSEEWLKHKMTEGIQTVLHTDINLYASLFDFIDPWKIDLMDFMENNYMKDLSLTEMAYYTGRSLSTFKRDFKKYSDLTPEKWLIRRRLSAARELIRNGRRRVSQACFDVGFRNLSHFSKIYKETFGLAPTAEFEPHNKAYMA